MRSQFSVLQYTPDPVAGERINIGVVVWDEEKALCRCTNNWRRLRPILGDSLESVQEFASHLSVATQNWRPTSGGGFYETIVARFVGNWASNIQFTEPRSSIKLAPAALNDIASTFISIVSNVRDHRRTRSTAVSLAVRALRNAVSDRISEEVSLTSVVLRPIVTGALEKHMIDAALKNGELISGFHALSFETSEPSRLQKDVEATAWIVEDIRKTNDALRLSVFALPPTEITERAYTRATHLFQAMKVPLISEADLPRWAAKQADQLADHLHEGKRHADA